MNRYPIVVSCVPVRRAVWTVGLVACALVSLVAPPDALAQQKLYRIVDADGRVTFTDRPPPQTSAGARVATPQIAAAPPTAALPADLAAVVNRYPVTLYVGPNCPGCEEGRNLLKQRGVPFNERTVNTARDGVELQRLTAGATLPTLMIGRQPLLGFRSSEWIGYLDAAGYPATSRLPANYNFPAAAPLAQPEREAAAAAPAPTPVATPAIPSGAGGIRF